jgi:hypothetical protein
LNPLIFSRGTLRQALDEIEPARGPRSPSLISPPTNVYDGRIVCFDLPSVRLST